MTTVGESELWPINRCSGLWQTTAPPIPSAALPGKRTTESTGDCRPGRTDQDRRRVEEALDHSVSANTRAMYASTWRPFEDWAQAPRRPRPAGATGTGGRLPVGAGRAPGRGTGCSGQLPRKRPIRAGQAAKKGAP